MQRTDTERPTGTSPYVPAAAWQALRCPQCAGTLRRTQASVECAGCGTSFTDTPAGQIDLRLHRSKRVPYEFQVGGAPVPPNFPFERLRPNDAPAVDFDGVPALWHLTPELRSYFPRSEGPDAIALDMGCGSGLHRQICEHAGFRWAGLDYGDPGAPILGDGHALPFADDSVSFVLSLAVLEHIRYPFVVASEVMRVLRPGGVYIGTVSYLEPFHGDSYYHHTHLGTWNTLATAGFEVVRVAPHGRWSGLRAQATMSSLFPRMPEPIAAAAVWPLDALHRLWWRLGRMISDKASDDMRLCLTTGSFEFVARKPG